MRVLLRQLSFPFQSYVVQIGTRGLPFTLLHIFQKSFDNFPRQPIPKSREMLLAFSEGQERTAVWVPIEQVKSHKKSIPKNRLQVPIQPAAL